MREQSSSHFVGLDIGTSTVRCVVGMLDDDSEAGKPSIIGHGSSPNIGMLNFVASKKRALQTSGSKITFLLF